MVTPFDQAIGNIPDDVPYDVHIYLSNLQSRLTNIRKIAQDQSLAAKEKQKLQYDKRHLVKHTVLKVGQKVLLHNPVGQAHHPRKYQTRISGPYSVHKVLQNNTYMLKNDDTNKTFRAPIHMDRLTVYLDPSPNDGTVMTHDKTTKAIKPPVLQQQPIQQTQQQIGDNAQHNNTVQTQPQIIKVLKCQRYRGAKLYQVKLSNGKSQWVNDNEVDDNLKLAFHDKYTMQGKVKQKQKHQ